MRYIAVTLEVRPDRAELAAELLGRVFDGVSIDRPIEAIDHDGGWRFDPARPNLDLRAYAPIDGREAAALARARTLLGDAGFPAPNVVEVDETDWAHAWKKFFRVQHLGRVVIRPTWRRYIPKPGDVVVDLDPGMAFGTGQHPTTRMCLRALQDAVRRGDRVLDVGSGSGILAIAAAKLGAREVLAVDTEPLAIDATRANAEANGVLGVLRVAAPGLLTPDQCAPPFDVVVANVNLAGLSAMAPLLAKATAPDGTLILSGLLAEGARTMERALVGLGMRRVTVRQGGDWRAVVLRHDG